MIRLILAGLIAAAATPVHAQPGEWRDRDRRDGVHLRILRDYDLRAGETAAEPVVVIGGSARIDGRVDDDVVVIGGTLRVGPSAMIRGDVTAVGGELVIDPAAQISGGVDHTFVAGPHLDFGLGSLAGGWWWPAFALGTTLLRLAIILIVALVLTVVAPDWILGIARRAGGRPLSAAVIGVAGQVLFVPLLVVVTIALVVSVVGLLVVLAYPFLFGALALLWVAGFTAVAINIGARIRRGDGVAFTPVGDLLVGFLLISALTLTAQALAVACGAWGTSTWILRIIGWGVEWTAWTVGLGAALTVLLGGREPVMPPPLPFAPPAATPS